MTSSSRSASGQAEEAEMDEEDFPNLTLIALMMLLEANVTQICLDALTPDSREIVKGFHILDASVPEVNPLGVLDFSNSPQRRLERTNDDAPSSQALDEADQITTPSEKDGHWKQAKSRRRRKSTSKQKGSWQVN
ncbi:hypothetical protein Nepgr_003863 [Nepenthes gracilis]|uniref:Uncharacterized protein n=1 Tax=Nepenthes gracilis TaxID=150966 RepID=A0AAD3XE95_NEPGR|nr:hypothetical protein Nepgr_003863 [Nepenthes gracilis]